jgi:spermidine/putrescine ABC transporter ATP-binding subunit
MGEVYIDSVTIKYGNVKALENFSLHVKDGAFVALLGPSGCGKTTCLRTVAGLIRPQKGNVYIDGKKVDDIPINKRQIGIVFQNYALFPHKNVFGNVAFGLRMKKMRKPEIRESVSDVLRMLHLEGFEERYPIQLSGGQQQRVALARALVTRPTVLLLDEPLGALDKNLREEMQIELRILQKKLKITTIFVTHDQEEALTMADDIAIMNEGIVEQSGTPEGIYNKPQNKFVASFIGVTNFLPLIAVEIEKEQIVCRLDDEALGNSLVRIRREGGIDTGRNIEIAIRPEKIGISKMRKDKISCNNIGGTIENIVYKGSFTRYYISVGNKFVISSQQVSHEGESEFYKVGDKIYLNWNIEDNLFLRK